MRAVVSDRARLQRMLDVEIALMRAQAALGVIPALTTDKIADAAKAERFDLNALGTDTALAGNLAAALSTALATEVAKADVEAARYVQFGATDQDVIDTALMLEIGRASCRERV